MKSVLKRIIRKINRTFLPQDEASIRRRTAMKEGRFLCFRKPPYVYRTNGIKAKFYLPYYRTDYIQQKILSERNYYEAANLNYICKQWHNGHVGERLKGGQILDIGANIGNHTLFFFCECEIGYAHCFEPIESTRKLLKRNLEINDLLDKVEIHPVAVGEKPANAEVDFYDSNNIGSTSLKVSQTGEIPIVCIDNIKFDKRIDLIKIDVEGFELQVLKGCIRTISTHLPYLMIEIRDEYLDEIKKLLMPLNYKVERLSGINYFFYE